MTTPAEFTALAGVAVVGSMGTEAWQYAKSRCIELFRRHAPGESEAMLQQLDGYAKTVSAAPEAVRRTVASHITGDVARQFAAVAARSPEAADAVRALPGALREASDASVNRNASTYGDIKSGRDSIVSGRDSHINKGE